MKKISITGVDGSGKTSVVRELQKKFATLPGEVRAFRAPQYHEDPNAPLGRLSARIDDLSVLADKLRQPILKTAALFLSMTLYGDVESHYERTFRPRFLFSERQAIADSLTYSHFYKGLLKGPLDRAALEGVIRSGIGENVLSEFEGWMAVLRGRLPEGSAALDFWNLPLLIRDLFNLPPEELVARLQSVYHCAIPDEIVLLRVDPTRLIERMAKKAAEGTEKELHEQPKVMEALQGALVQSCGLLAKLKPGMKLHVIETGDLGLEQVRDEVLARVGLAP